MQMSKFTSIFCMMRTLLINVFLLLLVSSCNMLTMKEKKRLPQSNDTESITCKDIDINQKSYQMNMPGREHRGHLKFTKMPEGDPRPHKGDAYTVSFSEDISLTYLEGYTMMFLEQRETACFFAWYKPKNEDYEYSMFLGTDSNGNLSMGGDDGYYPSSEDEEFKLALISTKTKNNSDNESDQE